MYNYIEASKYLILLTINWAKCGTINFFNNYLLFILGIWSYSLCEFYNIISELALKNMMDYVLINYYIVYVLYIGHYIFFNILLTIILFYIVTFFNDWTNLDHIIIGNSFLHYFIICKIFSINIYSFIFSNSNFYIIDIRYS